MIFKLNVRVYFKSEFSGLIFAYLNYGELEIFAFFLGLAENKALLYTKKGSMCPFVL